VWNCILWSGLLVLSGCYSSIPSYKINSEINDERITGRTLVFVPIESVTGVSNQYLDSRGLWGEPTGNANNSTIRLEDRLSRSLFAKMHERAKNIFVYGPTQAGHTYTASTTDFIDAFYELDGVFHSVSPPMPIEEYPLPEGAVWKIIYYKFTFVDPQYFVSCCGGADLAISFSDVTLVEKVDSNNFFGIEKKILKLDGRYMIWDYHQNKYVTKGRLGPIYGETIHDLVVLIDEHINIANSHWIEF